MMQQNLMDSQGLSHDFRSGKHMGLYCVKYDQKNGVIADLEKIMTLYGEKKIITYPEEDQCTRARFLRLGEDEECAA